MMAILSRAAANGVHNQAEALAIGLEAGVVAVADVVVWAEKISAAEPRTGAGASEIATMGSCSAQGVADKLRSLSRGSDRAVAEVLVARWLLQMREADAPRARSLLCKLALSGVVHDSDLRAATRRYYQEKAEAIHRDDFDRVPLVEGRLAAAIVDFVDRSASILDPLEGAPPPPPWLFPKG